MATAANTVGRAMIAGVAGSIVMAAFQKLIEMPLTGRGESDQPAQLAQKVLPLQAKDKGQKDRLNYITHLALGAMWGAAYGAAAYKGLRGHKAIAAVFPAIYSNDIITTTSLGLAKPWDWSGDETAIDVVDKLVQVAATSFIFDRFLDPERP